MKFYKQKDKHVIVTNLVTGDEDDSEPQQPSLVKLSWEQLLESTNENNREIVNKTMQSIKIELNCHGSIQ